MNLQIRKEFPRLPLSGNLDITYRCNNNCRHCWLKLPINSIYLKDELSLNKIMLIVDEARTLGCRTWSISGGEPMIRSDFSEIIDYINRKVIVYKLNTNGTLITPKIARLMTQKGHIMVSIYGATPEVHDRVTQNTGSFEETMRGFAYLKEAGVKFTVQLVPMKENYFQYELMLALAISLSSYYRIGAPWLWLTADHNNIRNSEILKQRLSPCDVIDLDKPSPLLDLVENNNGTEEDNHAIYCNNQQMDERLFASCIAKRRDFHIDPYGQLSFCYYIKDPSLRFNLLEGTLQQGWEEFIPSLANVVIGGQEYLDNCGSCKLRNDCRWCGVFSYLETGRYSAKVNYLCRMASANRQYKDTWMHTNVRHYKIAGITIQLSAEFPITEKTFVDKFKKFQVDGPGTDTVMIHHVSTVPEISDLKLGKEVYHRAPWAIYSQPRSWVYLGISENDNDPNLRCVAIFDSDHNRGTIYNKLDFWRNNGVHSLTSFPSDQILLARILANRQGCILHAAGIIIDGKGFAFVGHSEAGKSTIMKMLKNHGEILCDDRIIIRRWIDGFRVYGTWSHGELSDISSSDAVLKAIFYIEKASLNEISQLYNRSERLNKLLGHIIKPLITRDWWIKTLDLAEVIAEEVPAYCLKFDKSDTLLEIIRNI